MLSATKIEILHKEIDLIQNCINRMAANSFLIKGWFFTLILGFITLGYEKFNISFLISISLIITLFCWISDAFFLQLERKYIKKYNWIIQNRASSNDFLYNLDPNEKLMWIDNSKIKFFEVLFSRTLLLPYIITPLVIVGMSNIFFISKEIDLPTIKNLFILIMK